MQGELDSIESLGLGARVNNALRQLGITRVGQLKLATRSLLLKTKNVGKGTVQRIEDALRERGMTLSEEGGAEAQAVRDAMGVRAENERLREENRKLQEENQKLREENEALKNR